MSGEFVFATAQYESGDWDSAPLVPPNIIDTIARYTEIVVAPTGVVVPLADDRMLRYPLLYLTGHLPLRFTDAERANVRRFVDRGGGSKDFSGIIQMIDDSWKVPEDKGE